MLTVYQRWEEVLRPQAVTLLGLSDKDDVKIPILGDLGLLRNDVVHHRGVASAGNTSRCEVLTHWFAVGDRILIDPRKAYEFVKILCVSQYGYQISHLSSEWLEASHQGERQRFREAVAVLKKNSPTPPPEDVDASSLDRSRDWRVLLRGRLW